MLNIRYLVIYREFKMMFQKINYVIKQIYTV